MLLKPSANDRKIERAKDMCALKRGIILYLFRFIEKRPRDQWWSYKGEFEYEGTSYNLECDCMWDNKMFQYKNLHIEHKQEVIDIADMIRKGLLQ